MKRRFFLVGEALKEWRNDPKYVAAYDALEGEFVLAAAPIQADGNAHITPDVSDHSRQLRV